MRTLSILSALAFAGMAQAQTGVKSDPNVAAQASNAFACDLFKQLDAQNAGKNLFFSPFSISSALAMAFEGARTGTALEMGEVLGLPAGLRQQNPTQPWLTEPYLQGFTDFDKRASQSKDDVKAAVIREQLKGLRKQLDEINQKIRAGEKTGKFDFAASKQANKLAAEINTLAQQVDQYELKIANALFGDKSYPFKQTYIDRIDKFFGSGHLRQVDFRNDYPRERVKINRWVEEQTNDRINNLLPELKPAEYQNLALVLINAIFFKGEWSRPFDEKMTKDEPFLLSGGGKAPTKMMNHPANKDARYAAFNGDGSFFTTPAVQRFDGGEKDKFYPGDDGFTLAEIPIKGDRISMVVIAPRKVDGLPALEAKLTGENLTQWLGKLQARPVQIAMPRFKMETDYKLADTLKSMGMTKAFTERVADFSEMTTSKNPDEQLYISRVIHKAFVEVNEKGAEAAAATAVMMAMPTSAPISQPFTPSFRADRPFLFLIRDRDSGMILFLGRMTQPS